MKMTKMNRLVNGISIMLLSVAIPITAGADNKNSEEADKCYVIGDISQNNVSKEEGSKKNPYGSLADVETDLDCENIEVLYSAVVLDGSIALRGKQKIKGEKSADGSLPRMTNSVGGPIVELANGNEVAGIHFQPISGSAIVSGAENYSDTYIHQNLFSELPGSTPFAFNIVLINFAAVSGVRIEDNIFRDCAFMGSIVVQHFGSSLGDYSFKGNRFNDMNQRSYIFWTFDTSAMDVIIKDSYSNNIGVGNANADNILIQLSHKSTMDVLVDNLHYDNSAQVGNHSNTGLEVFFLPTSFPIGADGSSLNLEIINSSFSNVVTETIFLFNAGSNNIMNAAIRNTQITNANPQEIKLGLGIEGGAITMISEISGLSPWGPLSNSGSQFSLLIENSDITGSTGYGLFLADLGADGSTSTIDLGGGALGSVGQNRILDHVFGDVYIAALDGIGGSNWWGENGPEIIEVNGGNFDVEPILSTDPCVHDNGISKKSARNRCDSL